MQATTVREALRASLAGTFGTMLSVLPRLIVFAIALVIGWAISSLLARATIAVLAVVRFDEMARRSGLARFIQNMGVQQSPSSVVASVSKWLVRLMTLVVALDVLGLPAGSGVLHQLLLWLPNLAVGLVALVIGGLAATALSRLVQGSAAVAGIPNPRVLAAATSIAVWAFAVVVAVSQLGVATSVVNLALVGVVGGVALAAGLAFGWAGRDRAQQLLSLLDDWRASPSGTAASPSPFAPPDLVPPPASDSPTSAVPTTSISASSPAAAASTSAPPPDALEPAPPPVPTDRASVPVLDPSAPVLEGSAPEFGAAAPALEPFAAELVLFPEDEPALEPAGAVPFEESWMPRSGLDRRRIARPGPDRRASVA